MAAGGGGKVKVHHQEHNKRGEVVAREIRWGGRNQRLIDGSNGL